MVYEPLKMVFAILGVEIEKKLLKIWECLAQEKKKDNWNAKYSACFHFI